MFSSASLKARSPRLKLGGFHFQSPAAGNTKKDQRLPSTVPPQAARPRPLHLVALRNDGVDSRPGVGVPRFAWRACSVRGENKLLTRECERKSRKIPNAGHQRLPTDLFGGSDAAAIKHMVIRVDKTIGVVNA
jgi:hypothetical protein